MQSLTVLGSTGSIGVSTLDVIGRHPDKYKVYALTANTQVDDLFAQCQQFLPEVAVMRDESAASNLEQLVQSAGLNIEVLSGEQGLLDVAAHTSVDTVMAAIVGGAGLGPTLSAVRAGKKVLLANKEALVMAGALFMDAVVESGAQLLPIDSEHNAIFQCLPERYSRNLDGGGVRKILLTGSGGPFRQRSVESFPEISPDQACAHPNWSMGRKISVDSATMMNKGLELIEACWLFNTSPDHIEIVVHPQSVIHSMVEYIDGSVLAQLGNPDMRTPIAHALAWPERMESGVGRLDIIAQARLDFEAPDDVKFPALRLSRQAAEQGGTAAAILNAANEIAVQAFLDEQIRFDQIAEINEQVLNSCEAVAADSIETVLQADCQARKAAQTLVDSILLDSSGNLRAVGED